MKWIVKLNVEVPLLKEQAVAEQEPVVVQAMELVVLEPEVVKAFVETNVLAIDLVKDELRHSERNGRTEVLETVAESAMV